MSKLKNKLCIHSDAALCLILSFSLGIGVLCSSYIQLAIPTWYRYSLIYLFGQHNRAGQQADFAEYSKVEP